MVASFYGWYDEALKDESVRYGAQSNGYTPNARLHDDGFPNLQKFSGANLMKAYAFATFHLGDHPLDVRAGRQVIDWGKTLFATGINTQVNAMNIVALTRPGADRSEPFVPAGALFGRFGATDNLSVEAFYKFQWEESPMPPCGVFMAVNDANIGPNPAACDMTGLGVSGPVSSQTGNYLPLPPAIRPPWAGQGGIAVKFNAPALKTNFGFYAMNVHANLPLGLFLITASGPGVPGSNRKNAIPLDVRQDPSLIAMQAGFIYPTDVQTYAITTSTQGLGGWLVNSELSFSPDTPIMGNAADVVRGALFGTNLPTFNGTWAAAEAAVPPQTYFPLYDRFNKVELDVNARRAFDGILGASKTMVAAEVLAEYTNVPYNNGVNRRYGRGYIYGFAGSPTFDVCAVADANPHGCQNAGFVNNASWGYRLFAQLQYESVWGMPLDILPSLFFAQDVSGVSIDYQLNSGRMTVAPQLQFVYKKTSVLQFNFTVFPDSEGFNATHDRAFYAVSYSYRF